jgi:hypothetical protein
MHVSIKLRIARSLMFVPDTYVGDRFSDQMISKTIWQPAITGQSIALQVVKALERTAPRVPAS